ncbi:alpha/beta fold hydrolase [Actinacidiphila paucisporea]|uniref:Non-heme chloroperoxidase n=1 Tax=Actinacidiphila paucisporea TaxID=310782 RepID=A0A1M7QWQ3_9ACTN|nr:alpha/beta hydrolase [Actinacidiphila paucisporea]SHN36319.1 non-heme chloroperoxidase [Actinacidiphila paucisporea]
MSTFTVSDGTTIHYTDWGQGRPVVFSHGWPLSGEAWAEQMRLVAEHGFRAIAHDRRGHGRSDNGWTGHHMNTYADDLAQLIEHLDLHDAILVGHSTGGGEVTRYLGRHGTARTTKAVLLGAVPPLMLQTDANPGGLPRSAFDNIRDGVARDRAQFYADLAIPFYGANREGHTVSDGVRQDFWRISMQAGLKAAYDCIAQFSETDFTDDLKSIDVPVLVAHGDDDQIVPIGAAGLRSAELLKDATLRVYPGAPHGLVGSFKDAFHADLLAFINA